MRITVGALRRLIREQWQQYQTGYPYGDRRGDGSNDPELTVFARTAAERSTTALGDDGSIFDDDDGIDPPEANRTNIDVAIDPFVRDSSRWHA